MNILVFEKTYKGHLSPYLTTREYRCRCFNSECTRTLIVASTVRSFNRLRTAYGKRIIVNSAFRCQKHNEAVGGVEDSFHKIGAAMDLRPEGDFTTKELDILEGHALLYFDIVLRYDGFIHCHNVGSDRDSIQGEQ